MTNLITDFPLAAAIAAGLLLPPAIALAIRCYEEVAAFVRMASNIVTRIGLRLKAEAETPGNVDATVHVLTQRLARGSRRATLTTRGEPYASLRANRRPGLARSRQHTRITLDSGLHGAI